MTEKSWLKGNLHTHTTNSDGDESPEHVAEWYHEHGYDWLCLSDHDHLTILEGTAAEKAKWPLLVHGEEVTSRGANGPVHVNGYGVTEVVKASDSDDIVTAMRENVERIIAAGGMASINHPNFRWAFDGGAMMQVEGYKFMEVFNGHPESHNEGGGGKTSTVGIWDRLLSQNRRVWGIAVDDAHHYTGEFTANRSNPGRGWVQVRASSLSQQDIYEAMSDGDFYASTGVTIGGLTASMSEIKLEIDPETTPSDGIQAKYTTVFTGANGRVLHESISNSPSYKPTRLDGYVRATVYSSRGTRAWTQPVFTGD
ncbi:MAG: CehA/McbA family metallohydrolase [Chloroflexi bacterium]|nr:CehA/McbA family metallohydrolase [Chloroflexota bacterium]